MRTLIFSDLHLHAWKNFNIDLTTGLSKRLVDQQKVLQQVVSLTRKEKIDNIVIGGDIFHSVGSLSTEVVNTADRFFKALKTENIPYYLVKGNHDITNRKDPKWYHYSGEIFNSALPPSTIKLIHFSDVINYTEIKNYDIVVVHQTPLNSKVGNYQFSEGVDWKTLSKNNKWVLFGHIHQRQELSNNCIIVGSFMQLTFGDSHEAGCYIIDTDKNTKEFIKLDSPKFITVDTIEEAKDDGNYYRVLNSVSKDIKVNSNTLISVSPVSFKERIKSDTLDGIVKEWLVVNQKPETYTEVIKEFLDAKLELGTNIYSGKLKEVVIKNFGSIENISYKVTPGFTMVTGQNDVFDSNGSGKTTLFEAIYWCLFGETTKGLTGDDVVRRGEKDCEVILTLDSTIEEYKITRSRKKGLSLIKEVTTGNSINLTEGMKQESSQKRLESFLGFDSTLFSTSCYFSQENLLMLTGLTDSEKTNLITGLLGFESYDLIQNKIKTKIDTINQEIIKYTTNLNYKEKDLAIKNNDLTHYKYETDKINEEIEQNLRYRAVSKLAITNLNKGDIFEVNLPELELKVANSKEEIKKYEQEISVLREENTIKLTSIATIEEKINNLVNSKSILSKEIVNLKSLIKGNKCNKCGSQITENNIGIFVKEKTEEIRIIQEQENLNRDLLESSKITQSNLKSKALNTKLKIEDLNKGIEELNTQVNNVKTTKLKQELEVKNQEKVILRYEEEYQKILLKEEENKKNINSTQDSILLINQEITIIKELVEVNKNNIGILDFWKIGFSPSGIRSLLLDRFCNEFNLIVNEYLSNISTGSMQLTLSPTSLLKSGEERNKIGLSIKLDEVDVKYESLSGGEKRRIDASLCFGMSKYITTKYKLNNHGLLGITILDEIFSGLDKSGEDALGTVIYNESRNKALYVIDHGLDLGSYADSVWVVKKTNGVSKLEIT